MKRYFAMVLAVVLLCICTGAVAMGWGRADNPPPPSLYGERGLKYIIKLGA